MAVPNCVPRPGDETARTACQTISEVLRNDLRFESVRFVPESLITAIPPQDPDDVFDVLVHAEGFLDHDDRALG